MSYDAVRVPEDGLTAFVAGLDETWRGLSLTMPLKRSALALAGSVTDRAPLAGAANTLVLERGSVVLADNTDLPGAAAAVRERYDGPVTAATVLGGGATAASTGLAMCDLGADAGPAAWRASRNGPQAAAAVIARHPSGPRSRSARSPMAWCTARSWSRRSRPAAQDPDLVARCADVPVVFEVVYDPWPTPLAAVGAATGCWSADSTCWSTRPCSSSSSSPGCPARSP